MSLSKFAVCGTASPIVAKFTVGLAIADAAIVPVRTEHRRNSSVEGYLRVRSFRRNDRTGVRDEDIVDVCRAF